jgi:hypothetical protein
MNSLRIKKNWQAPSSKLKRQFADLNSLLSQKDKNETLLGSLKIHIGKAEEDLRKIISNL